MYNTNRLISEYRSGLGEFLNAAENEKHAREMLSSCAAHARNLEYWKLLEVRHCIDLMHIEKNVTDSVIRLLLNIKGKTKDGFNARKDMEDMKIRPGLVGPQVDVSPTGLPSSCASTGMNAQDRVVPSVVDHMNEDTASFVLQVMVMEKFSSDAAEGLVFRPSRTIRVHGAQLLDGHAKIQVDSWVTFPLENPPNDEILTLGAAKGTYIQWPKSDIIIRMKPNAPPIPKPKDSMPPAVEPNVEASIGQALTGHHFGCGLALEVEDVLPNLPSIKIVV
uniref:DUF8039 domain-containing protein n=1 Tax=Oryza brachyantha TaxID=4533 RepID=J3MW25_ORYBR